MRIATFKADDPETLDSQVNEFLESNAVLSVRDIKFCTIYSHSSLSTGVVFSAMVMYTPIPEI